MYSSIFLCIPSVNIIRCSDLKNHFYLSGPLVLVWYILRAQGTQKCPRKCFGFLHLSVACLVTGPKTFKHWVTFKNTFRDSVWKKTSSLWKNWFKIISWSKMSTFQNCECEALPLSNYHMEKWYLDKMVIKW